MVLSSNLLMCALCIWGHARATECMTGPEDTCQDKTVMLQSKVSINGKDEMRVDVVGELMVGPGEDMATTKLLEGVPIYNYHMAHAGGMQPSLLELSQPKQWVLMFPDSFTDAQLDDFCDDLPGNSTCELKGHPDANGLDFVEFTGTQGELQEVLTKYPGVKGPKFIEPDMQVQLVPEIKDEDTSDALVEVGNDVPWGLDRIDGGLDGSYHFPAGSTQGAGAHVYVADTGVRTTHQDFEGRAVALIDCTRGGGCKQCNHGDTLCARDMNGHGTHCAGTIGGKKYGVAKKVSIYGAKVLDDEGSGYLSWILGSLDWVKANGKKPAIWSASLGSEGRSEAYRVAVEAAVKSGIVVSVAAGNENQDACTKSPSFVPAAITVGATDSQDTRASFSNYGSCLDIYAPGVHIKSATHENDYGEASLSGTSMACPHVSGVLAMILGDNPSMSLEQAEALLKGVAVTGMVKDAKVGSPNLMLNVPPSTAPPSPPTAPPGIDLKVEQGPCTIDAGNPKCVLSPNFPHDYDVSQSCKIVVVGQVPLDVQSFKTEQDYDKLNVNGKDYSGNSGPTGVTAQGDITWSSDDTVAKGGWKICSDSAGPTLAPTPAPTAAPTPAPPSSWTCSLSHQAVQQYCSNVKQYPFIAATADCAYAWYHLSASDAKSGCQSMQGNTAPCYVYDSHGSKWEQYWDQYGIWCE